MIAPRWLDLVQKLANLRQDLIRRRPQSGRLEGWLHMLRPAVILRDAVFAQLL
jgi:hypothetical protein